MNGAQIHTLLLQEGITPATVEHGGEQRIKLIFENKLRLTDAVRQIAGRKWSKTMHAWHIPKDKQLLEQLLSNLKATSISTQLTSRETNTNETPLPWQTKAPVRHAVKKIKALNAEMLPKEASPTIGFNTAHAPLEKFTDKIKLKGYSSNTLRSYHSHFASYLSVIANAVKQSHASSETADWAALLANRLDSITKDEIEKYLRWRQKNKVYSESDQNQHINAVKFYYESVLGRARMLFDLPRPLKPKQLPAVWAEEDIAKLIKAIANKKHRLMLLMAYAHGMRVSEVASLKLTDMDSKRMIIHIKASKGKKDRIVNLSEGALAAIRSYYKEYKPKLYLFENENTREAISVRTIQEVFQAAKKKAGLSKKAGMHSLRHSFATHLHESGIDIKYIKDLLGHNDLRTTEQYTHVSKRDMGKIKSPFDNLKM